MAYKKQVQGRSYPYMYNLHKQVGGGAAYSTTAAGAISGSSSANRRDDVMLVQYLLKKVYQRGLAAQPPLVAGVGDPHNPALLKVDGLFGPKTKGSITKFQFDMRHNGRNIATDGCVDPELGDSSTASISKTGYTISWLNKYFWVLYPETAPNPATDPDCPAELRQSLTT